jgi:hypothetical protein
MEKYEPGEYTEGVMESVRVLRDQSQCCLFNSDCILFNRCKSRLIVIPNFAERIRVAIDALRTKSGYDDGKVNDC